MSSCKVVWPYKHKYLLPYFLKHRWAAKKVFLAWPLNCKFFSGMAINYYLWDFTQNRRLFQSVVLPGLFFCLFQPIGSWKWARPAAADHREHMTAETAEPGTQPSRNPRLTGTLPPAEWRVNEIVQPLGSGTPGGTDQPLSPPVTQSQDQRRGGRQRTVRRTTRGAGQSPRHPAGRVALGGWALR